MSSISTSQKLSAALQQLESQIAIIRAELAAANKTVPTEPKAEKPKRELSAGVIAWNKQVNETLVQMKADGWRHPLTGKEPIYRDALAEAARLRGLADPAIAAKQAEQKAKKAEKKAEKASSASSVVSAPESAPSEPSVSTEKKAKKNPWADMTDEQKAERVAKMKAGREAKKLAAAEPAVAEPAAAEPASDAESATSSVKKRGPPKGVKLSEEERIRRATKAKATRDAKKLAALPALPASAPESAAASVVVSDDEIDEETFTKQQLPNSSRIVYKNGLGHVRAYTPQGVGAWLGMYDPVKKAIDASVPEPEE